LNAFPYGQAVSHLITGKGSNPNKQEVYKSAPNQRKQRSRKLKTLQT
jgi:hypothetical protein